MVPPLKCFMFSLNSALPPDQGASGDLSGANRTRVPPGLSKQTQTHRVGTHVSRAVRLREAFSYPCGPLGEEKSGNLESDKLQRSAKNDLRIMDPHPSCCVMDP